MAGGQNFGFPVFLNYSGSDPLSDCFYDFVYLNTNQDNYQTIVATLLSDDYQHKSVLLHASKESSGFCRIDEVER